MSAPPGYQTARLEIQGGDIIECLFNPREYSIAKTNNWTVKPVTGTALPPAQFGGGQPRELTLNLLLDVSLLSPKDTVRDVTNKLFKLMEPAGGGSGGGPKSVPPLVTFRWGRQEDAFKAVIRNLTVTFQLFHPNGDPIRADVKMQLVQAEQASSASSGSAKKKGNPTTRAIAGLGVHLVRDGDTLPSIAYETYGDATRWRVIAEANDLDNPLHLRRGATLTLPRLEG